MNPFVKASLNLVWCHLLKNTSWFNITIHFCSQCQWSNLLEKNYISSFCELPELCSLNVCRIWTHIVLYVALQVSIGKQWKDVLDYNDKLGYVFHVSCNILICPSTYQLRFFAEAFLYSAFFFVWVQCAWFLFSCFPLRLEIGEQSSKFIEICLPMD
jgi:hypothetical protein